MSVAKKLGGGANPPTSPPPPMLRACGHYVTKG